MVEWDAISTLRFAGYDERYLYDAEVSIWEKRERAGCASGLLAAALLKGLFGDFWSMIAMTFGTGQSVIGPCQDVSFLPCVTYSC